MYVYTYRTYQTAASQATLGGIAVDPQHGRSRLSPAEARKRYVEIGEQSALEQIRADSEELDRRSIAIGPFARLDANAVAAHDGKTRGAISNLFGSQAAFQAETMALALSAGDWLEKLDHPAPRDFATAEAWLDSFLLGESAHGPRHNAEPAPSYAMLWALWLSTVPYGLWSEEVRRPSMEEYAQKLARLESALGEALEHFELTLRKGTTLNDLACAFASMIEGCWLNQCLTAAHPSDPSVPIATLLRRSGRLLWHGATEPRDEAQESQPR